MSDGLDLRAVRWALALLVVVAVAVGIGNLGRKLANPDEGRYSEIAREMAVTGDWVTPRLNGIKYFEKPPLQYWSTALAFRLFGESAASARLYVALCGLLTILAIGFTGLKLGDREFALASMLVLVSSPYFMALGGIVTLDMGLTLWTTVAFCAFCLGLSAPQGEGRRWLALAWAAMALAVLSKGLVGALIPAAALFLYSLACRDWRLLRDLEWGRGIAIFFAIAAPWFVLVSLQNPEFAQFFFIHEHFTRFLTGEHRRTQAWWYFVPILALGFLPWMFALPAAVAHAWRTERARSTFRPLTFALAWSGFVVVFFSASGSKLPAYILPAFPPLALVLGRYLVDAPAKRLALWALSMAFVALVLAWIAWTAPEDASDDWSRAMYVAAEGWTFLGAGLLFALGLAAAALLWLGRRWLALLALALSVVLAIECLVQAFEKFSPRQSGYEVAQKMLPLLNPGTRLYSVQHYEQTVPFYVGRTMTIVDFVDEFETGFASEPQRWIARLEDFPAAWLRPGEALAIMQPDTYQKLRGQGLPMQLLHEDPRRVLVRKP